jgi:hypothetical protein
VSPLYDEDATMAKMWMVNTLVLSDQKVGDVVPAN